MKKKPSLQWPWGKLILGACLIGAIALFFAFDGGQYLSLESLKANRDRLHAYTERHYVLAVGSFIGLYILQTALSLPGSLMFTLAGGLLFGAVLGTVYDIIGGTIGATLAFLTSRYLFRDWVEQRLRTRLQQVREGFRRNGFCYLLSLRLMPVFPFFIVNLLSGLTPIRVRTFVLATVAGSIPVTFVYANAGRQIGEIQDVGDILSPVVLGSLALLGVLALVPVLLRKVRGKGIC
jgi:uncharacterized membrane protein YdjX (TVP38/TMEM64 family)